MGTSSWAVRKVGIFPVNGNQGETSVIYTLERNHCRQNISKGSRLPTELIYKKSHTDAARCRLAPKSEQTRRGFVSHCAPTQLWQQHLLVWGGRESTHIYLDRLRQLLFGGFHDLTSSGSRKPTLRYLPS